MKNFIFFLLLISSTAAIGQSDTVLTVKEYKHLQDVVDSLLAANGNAGVMSRNEVNAALLRRYRKGEVDTLLAAVYLAINGKQNSLPGTPLYGIPAGYEKTTYNDIRYKNINWLPAVSDLSGLAALLLAKVDTGTSYTKSQTDALLFDKANNSTIAGVSNAVNARLKITDTTGKWGSAAQTLSNTNAIGQKADTNQIIKTYGTTSRTFGTKIYYARIEGSFANGYTIDYSSAGFANPPALIVQIKTPTGLTTNYSVNTLPTNTATSAVLKLVTPIANLLTGAVTEAPVTTPVSNSVLNIIAIGN